MTWCGLKIKENYHILVNKFHGNFRSKTLSFKKIKSVFRDVKWCFNASWGLKGLTLGAFASHGSTSHIFKKIYYMKNGIIRHNEEVLSFHLSYYTRVLWHCSWLWDTLQQQFTSQGQGHWEVLNAYLVRVWCLLGSSHFPVTVPLSLIYSGPATSIHLNLPGVKKIVDLVPCRSRVSLTW